MIRLSAHPNRNLTRVSFIRCPALLADRCFRRILEAPLRTSAMNTLPRERVTIPSGVAEGPVASRAFEELEPYRKDPKAKQPSRSKNPEGDVSEREVAEYGDKRSDNSEPAKPSAEEPVPPSSVVLPRRSKYRAGAHGRVFRQQVILWFPPIYHILLLLAGAI